MKLLSVKECKRFFDSFEMEIVVVNRCRKNLWTKRI